MTFAEARRYLDKGLFPDKTEQILDEIDWFIRFYKASAKILLFYERIALHGIEDNSLRITFDSDIRFRTENLDFVKGDGGMPLLAPGERIMELKIAGAIPVWLSKMFVELDIYPVSFSKFGTAYHMYKGGKRA